jgi:hypothetical protein
VRSGICIHRTESSSAPDRSIERHLLREEDAELDDPANEAQQERHDERELDRRCAVLVAS